MGDKKPMETPESEGKQKKGTNFLDSLKIDEGIGKIREKLN
jgi:hypothetical protein